MEQETIHIENYKLPNGAIYDGEAKAWPWGTGEISGKGRARHSDGSIYEGQFDHNIPYGYGIYKFANGDYHIGFFDDLPNGPGYNCLNSENGMLLGQYKNGKLHGWAIGIRHGQFNCSFLQNGRVINDHTATFEWMQNFLDWTVFAAYKGNMIQRVLEEGYIRYGAPNRTAQKNGIKFRKFGVGFLFSTDNCMYVGQFEDITNLNGWGVKCLPSGEYLSGKWENNVLIKSERNMKEICASIDLDYCAAQVRNIIK